MKDTLNVLDDAIARAVSLLAERGQGAPPELSSLRDLHQRTKKLARAHARPQSLGFFGPSQAGKSFLVGALLSHELGSLEVLGRRGAVDFLRDVNPAKGVESTGVVTRFSSQLPAIALTRGDFSCRMLALDAVLASLATGFLVECTAPARSGDRIERVLRDARLATGPAASPRYREAWDTVWLELGKRWGDRHPYLAELRRHPELSGEEWKRGISSITGWALVYTLLWGGAGYAPDVDALSRLLVLALEQLHHAEHVEIDLADVRAQSDGASLLDASCLNSLGTQRPPITVFDPASQREARLEPGALAALVAEIRMPLRPVAGSLLETTDLLDFPGGRALRGINGFGPTELSTGRLEHAIEVYKRGKLTFLFEQFAIDREITALVLCSPGPTKPEAIQMQHQVERWLSIRNGAPTPRDPHEIERPSLFLALTKFDTSLGALRSDNARDRWESRVGEACVDFWARGPASWMHHWGGRDRPFTNSYWIRNPYADQMNTLRPGQPDYELVKRGYHESHAVRTYIASYTDKWAAMEGDDERGMPKSGVPLLASALRTKLSENIKARELAAEARAIHGELTEVLRALVPTRDENELRQRLEHAGKALAEAVRAQMQRQVSGAAFGRLVTAATLPHADVEREVRRAWTGLAPMSIKTSDKVKKLMVHVLKWWMHSAAVRVREGELGLPEAQVERWIREVCTAKPMLVALGPVLMPHLSRSHIDFSLVATIFQLRIGDGLVTLFAPRSRRTPALPLRLTFSETSAPSASAGAAPSEPQVDWADVSFDDEGESAAADGAPSGAAIDLVFAGKERFEHWATSLPSLYVANAGSVAPALDPSAEQLSLVLTRVEGVRIDASARTGSA